MSEVRVAGPVRAGLGEGPAWLDPELLWVDITAGVVHLLDPVAGQDRAITVPQSVGAAVPAVDGSILLAVRDGFARLDPGTGRFGLIAPVEIDLPDNRMNDGKCDTAGRFWAGTQSERLTRGAGALYRLELDGSVTRVLDGVTISNGLGWSPDDRRFYYIDTATQRVDVFDHDPATGAIADRRTFVSIPDGIGAPDGMAVDRDGFVWVAFWDGWRVQRFDPDGRLEREVRFPVSHVTSCAFGGSGLETLFVTSSSVDEHGPMSAERLAPQPLAGSIFALDAPVPGLPTSRARVTPVDAERGGCAAGGVVPGGAGTPDAAD